MDSYKKCPLKKRPIVYEAVDPAQPENLSTKPEDLSLKRKLYSDDDHLSLNIKRSKMTPEQQSYHPVTWSSSIKSPDHFNRSLSPSSESSNSGDCYRETSLSPPVRDLDNIHLRGLNRHQHLRAELLIQEQPYIPYWDHMHGHHLPSIPTSTIQPEDLSLKSYIPIPALYHREYNQITSQEKIKCAPRYKCEECEKSYSTFAGLSKHQQFHCPAAECNQEKKFFNCEHCEKSYTTSGALKMHIRTHTLPCKCPTCGKAFSRPWLLQGHIRTHTGEKPFSCQHCSRAFADRSNLRAHLQTHADVKKYICNSCNKSFSRMSLLSKHNEGGCISIHHAYNL